MFRAVPLPVIRSLFTVHSALVYVIQVWRQLSSRTRICPARNLSTNLYGMCQCWVYSEWINSWWWAEELPETCRLSCQNKFGKLVHLLGFIIKGIESLIPGFIIKGIESLITWCNFYTKDDSTEQEFLWTQNKKARPSLRHCQLWQGRCSTIGPGLLVLEIKIKNPKYMYCKLIPWPTLVLTELTVDYVEFLSTK